MAIFEVSNPAPRTFELRGELDMATVPSLLEAVTPALHEPGDLLFDLHELSFMDTTACHAMIQIAEPLADGSLLLTGPQHIVKRVIELTSLDGRGNIRVLDNESVPAKEAAPSSGP